MAGIEQEQHVAEHGWEGRSRALRVPVGLVNGIFTGLTGSQMMPLLPYMLALRLDTNRFVQANNIAVTLASAFLATALLARFT